MKKYVLSTIMGVESIAKKEIQKQGGIIEEVSDRLVIFSGGLEMIPRMNFWSRVGNKLYMLLGESNQVTDFDCLFDEINKVDWKRYFKKFFPIVVKATSVRSDLHSIPSIQRIVKKGIVHSLTEGDGSILREDEEGEHGEVFILLVNNKLRILLNTSGKPLHMRGYRQDSGKAPIKESLAAALVLLSGWKFKNNFYDPFCGSGTIVIEAFMIAKNIAPGLNRKFAFESLGLVDDSVIQKERREAQKQEFDGDYKIYGSDVDPEMIKIARANAHRVGGDRGIEFGVKDFCEYMEAPLEGTLVSNPPYGLRLDNRGGKVLYGNIDRVLRGNKNLNGGVISSYLEFDYLIEKGDYKKRKLYNGSEMCYFWKKL